MDLTPFITNMNSPMLKSQANILALQNTLNFTTSHQDLTSYPLFGSHLLNGVNGSSGLINPALCQNPSFMSSSMPELSGIKSEKNDSSPDPSLTPSSIKYETHTPRCISKSNEDAEGVWSPDIEIAFQEALQAYPPCGRRKIILTDEGKMYGRNELIARYIKEKTGKSRTRKQVSSHIQVLARKKSKEIQQQNKVDSEARNQILQRYSSMSSAQIVNEDLKEKAIKRAHESPPGSGLYYKAEIPIKTECQTITTSPGTLATSQNGRLSNIPFIKSENGKPDFLNQIMNTTQASLNGYFPTSLQNVAFPRTLSSIVDGSFGITRTARPLAMTPEAAPASSPSLPPSPAVPEQRLKMLKFNGYMEKSDPAASSWKHYFIDLNTESAFSEPNMERIDIEKIHDKFREFPHGGGSIKELFEAGPKSAFFLVKFWVDLNMPTTDSSTSDIVYRHDNKYESNEKRHIKVSTKACSFGKGVVEKQQRVSPVATDGRLIYDIDKSPLCDYMISFIYKLKDLPDTKLMNNVLENFTVLQHITDLETSETLLCIACVFEVSEINQSQYSIYRLVGH